MASLFQLKIPKLFSKIMHCNTSSQETDVDFMKLELT